MICNFLCTDKQDYEKIKKIAKKKNSRNLLFFIICLLCASIVLGLRCFSCFLVFVLLGILFLVLFIVESFMILFSKSFVDAVEKSSLNIPSYIGNNNLCPYNIKLVLGKNLLELVDAKYSKDNNINFQEQMLLPSVQLLRQKLLNKTGYIISNIFVQDDESIDENKCEIYIKDNLKLSFYVYYNLVGIEKLPDNFSSGDSIKQEYFVYDSPLYWVKEEQLSGNFQGKKYYALTVLFDVLENIYIKYVDEILDESDINKLMTLYRKTNKKKYNKIIKSLDSILLKDVLAALIKENISVKNLDKLFELIDKYKNNSASDISEKIREDNFFRVHITNMYASNGKISAYELTDELYELIKNSKSHKEEMLILEKFKSVLDINSVNIIICEKDIRLKLYNLLNEIYSHAIVIAYSEILKNVEITRINLIK